MALQSLLTFMESSEEALNRNTKSSLTLRKVGNLPKYAHLDHQALIPIQPWDRVLDELEIILSSRNAQKNRAEEAPLKRKSLNYNPIILAHSLQITIPSGIQLIRTIENPRSGLRSVLFLAGVSGTDSCICLDSHHVRVWKGSTCLKRLPINDSVASAMNTNSKSPAVSRSLDNINKWIYLENHRIYIVVTTHLQIRVRV